MIRNKYVYDKVYKWRNRNMEFPRHSIKKIGIDTCKIAIAVAFVFAVILFIVYTSLVIIYSHPNPYKIVIQESGLVSLWTFQERAGKARVADGPNEYHLREDGGEIERVKDGIFGHFSAYLKPGTRFVLPRSEAKKLNFYGHADQELSIVAWIKRMPYCGFPNYTSHSNLPCCEFIAGMFNESTNHRQYGLFLNLHSFNSSDQVCGLISDNGGDTPGHKGCVTGAFGKTKVPYFKWSCIAMTYNNAWVKAYLNGKLDKRDELNPFNFTNGIFDGGKEGADFTVGSNSAFGEKHNYFHGLIGGLAVFNKVLTDQRIEDMCTGFYDHDHD